MSFKDYFDDIHNLVNKDTSGTISEYDVYGYDVDDYVNNQLGPINFWTDSKVDEDTSELSIILNNPLVVETTSYDMTNLYFNTRCVGHAIEHGYDSVVIETGGVTHVITIDFDEDMYNVGGYITEAGKKRVGPLANTRIPKEKRDELLRTQKARRAAAKKDSVNKKTHKALKRPTNTSRPKKAPAKGMRVDVMLANTGKLSPDRVERAMKQVRKQPPKLTGVKDVSGEKFFRAEYNFKSIGSSHRQLGYADVSQDKQYCNELFCTCSDFFYRLYAPYVAAGLSTWNVPPKYKSRQVTNVGETPSHKWTVETNPMGKLFLCKHLWAFLAYYVAGDAGNLELSDDEIDDIISKYFDDVDGSVDGTDDSDNSTLTPFAKAFGKLYVGQKGQDIEHYKTKDDVKTGDRRQTFYQLPTKKQKDEPEEEV